MKDNPMSVVSLVCGACSLLLFWVPYVALVLPVVGLVTGVVARSQIPFSGEWGARKANWGIGLSATAIAVLFAL